LTRAVLIEHLGRFTNDGRPDGPKLCYRFSRIDCDEFRDYLATNAIHFIMCSDGASSDAGSEPVDDYYKHIVHEISRRGYCVAFINDLEFRSARVCGTGPIARVMSRLTQLGSCSSPLPTGD
jgi:hypothetical protein